MVGVHIALSSGSRTLDESRFVPAAQPLRDHAVTVSRQPLRDCRAAGEPRRVGEDRGAGEAGAVRAKGPAVHAGGREGRGVRDRERPPGAAGVLRMT